MRIYDAHIKEVRGDLRAGVMCRCKYCGDLFYSSVEHLKHVECVIHGVEDFSKAFFVVNPGGHDDVKKVNFKVKHQGKDVSCYDVNGQYYRISRRNNLHFVIVNGVGWVFNGIGYNTLRGAKLTNSEKELINKCIDVITNM
jgi:hypothetical protein